MTTAEVPARPGATAGVHPHSNHAHLNKVALRVLIASLLTIAAPLWYLVGTNEPNGPAAFVLLIVSSVLLGCGVISLLQVDQRPPLLTAGIGIFEALKNLLVIVYIGGIRQVLTSDALTAFSYVALGLALALVASIFILTSWIMRHTTDHGGYVAPISTEASPIVNETARGDDEFKALDNPILRRHGVIQQLLRHRFLAAVGLLVAFLQVIVVLAFSLAFYNLAEGGRALQRSTARLRQSTAEVAGRRDHEQTVESTVTSTSNGVSQSAEGADRRVFLLTFREGAASLQCSGAVDTAKLDHNFFQPRTGQAWRVGHLRERGAVPADCEAEIQQIAWNVSEIEGLRVLMERLYVSAPDERYRAIVVSHANDPIPRSGFSSNYEISRARAEQVQGFVESLLGLMQRKHAGSQGPMNLEWLLLPASNGNASILSPKTAEFGALDDARLQKNLIAEVEILQIPAHLTALQRESFRTSHNSPHDGDDLQLLDYLYFMISSTGYGDLLPGEGFTQFTICVAKLFELFFLVVTFNVILAVRREPLSLPAGESPQA
jgi:hypothetical protein